MRDGIRLIKGDCLEVMKEIEDKSVDMILCDLPYGTTQCKWDTVIPFKPLWEQYNRVIKDNGAIVLFGQEPFSTLLRSSKLELYKYDWIWEKESGSNFPNAKNQPLKVHEVISVFSKGNMVHAHQTKNRMEYYPQGLIEVNVEKNLKNTRKADGGFLGARQNQVNKCYVQQYTNYPKTVLKFKKEKGLHPTQKPVPLAEYLIKTYTNEGETVLDNCMGSGTTAIACLNTNRNFIGIEQDDKYFEIAYNRINGYIYE